MDLLNDMDIYLLCKLYFHFSHFFLSIWLFLFGFCCIGLMVGYTNVDCCACGCIKCLSCGVVMDGWLAGLTGFGSWRRGQAYLIFVDDEWIFVLALVA